jgi:small subunit ribosomal protein S20
LANHKSALKRAMQNEIRRMRNKTVKTSVKKVTKELRLSLNEDSGEMTLKKLNTAQSLIDKAAKKGVIHKKTAARKISRLSKLAVATAT